MLIVYFLIYVFVTIYSQLIFIKLERVLKHDYNDILIRFRVTLKKQGVAISPRSQLKRALVTMQIFQIQQVLLMS